MANEIKTLYSDENKQNALYPRTKVNAISDADGNSLSELLKGINTTINFATTDTWTQEGGVYKITKSLSGITPSSIPEISCLIEPTSQTIAEENDAFNLIFSAITGDGTITFYATAIPTHNFVAQIVRY